MKLRKLLSLLLCLCMALSLAGCGDKQQEKSDKDIPTITWLIRCDAPKNKQPVIDELNKILEERIGVHINLEFIDTAAYQEKMNTYMASSKKYDLAFAGAGNPLKNAASKGGILPLDELLEEVPALKETIPDYAWELVKYDNQICGVPNLQVLPTALAALMDPDMLEKYGFKREDFTTFDSLEPYLEVIKANEPDLYPFSPTRTSETLDNWGYCNEYSKVDNIYFKEQEDGTWKGYMKYELPEYRKQVEKLYDWYKKGYIRSDIVSAEGDTHAQAAVSVAVYKPGIDALLKSQGKNEIGQLIGVPVIEKCQALTVLGKDAEHPVEALKLLELVNTDKEVYNLLANGIEGVHYEKVDDNTMRYIGNKDSNEYWINGAWRFGNQFNEYVKEGDDPQVWEKTAEYNESAKISPFLGFSVNDKNIRTELSQIETLLSRYSVMNMGAEDPDTYYDTFLDELKKSGSDKVVAEYEKQINEFVKTK